MSFYLFINDNIRGPYGETELRDMLVHHEVSANTTACRAGESDWSTVDALLNSSPAAAAPVARATSPIPARFAGGNVAAPAVQGEAAGPSGPPPLPLRTVYSSYYSKTPPRDAVQKWPDPIPSTFPGFGRGIYFLGQVGLAGMVVLMLRGGTSPVFSMSLWLLLFSGLVIFRVVNIGLSAWWFLLVFLPLVGGFFSLFCLSAPPGFRYTKKYDLTGKMIIGLFVALFVLCTVAIIFALMASVPRSRF